VSGRAAAEPTRALQKAQTAPASSANAEQIQRWNGDGGQRWIANRERHQASHQRLLPHLFGGAAISPGDRVLDVGCGCGETTIAAAQAASGGSALGLDLSAPMLEVARQLAAAAGVANAQFEQGDAQVYPLGQHFYDVAISKFGVLFFDDSSAAFANIARAVRPGGRLSFLSWQDDEHNEVFGIPRRGFAAVTRLADRVGEDLPFRDPRRIAELLAGAGWEDVRTEAVSEPALMGTDVDDVMTYMRGMRMVRELEAEIADDAVTERALAVMAEQYAARQRSDGVWVSAGTWLVTARRAPGDPA
jgi:ubiquinone/menaquinone biosynthesis C-methylase UbiE